MYSRASWRLGDFCVIVLEAVDGCWLTLVETPAAQFIRQDCFDKWIHQARAKRRLHAESGVDDLLGNGSLGGCRPLWFLTKALCRAAL